MKKNKVYYGKHSKRFRNWGVLKPLRETYEEFNRLIKYTLRSGCPLSTRYDVELLTTVWERRLTLAQIEQLHEEVSEVLECWHIQNTFNM